MTTPSSSSGAPSGPPYDPTTALLVIDLQNDFAHPKGSLYVRGGEDVVASANREVEAARSAGALVCFTQDWHPEHTPHFARDGGVWPVHCVADTWGAAFAAGLDVQGEVIRKGTGGEDGYSAFAVRDPERPDMTTKTGLEELLRSRQVGRVVVVGLATDYCVMQTALDALHLGFDTTVLRGATRPVDVNPGDGVRALAELEMAGAQVR